MATSNQPADDNAGSKRAAEFHEAMLGLPGYGDDSVLFVVRYINTAKQNLRECDFNEFMQCFMNLNRLWYDEKKESTETDEAKYEETQELKQKALSKIEEFPDLVRDFGRALSNGKSVARVFGNLEKKK